MNKKILVEDSLTDVYDFLSEKGFKVGHLNSNNMKSYDAIVVTGMDSNIMGIENTKTDKPIINADGKTSHEIYDQLKATLR